MDKSYYNAICSDFAEEAKAENYQNDNTLREWIRSLNEWNQFLFKRFLRANKILRNEAFGLMRANGKLIKLICSIMELPEEERARIKAVQ